MYLEAPLMKSPLSLVPVDLNMIVIILTTVLKPFRWQLFPDQEASNDETQFQNRANTKDWL